jgi:hypothetical protein
VTELLGQGLVAAPDRLASITRREWAKAVTN